MAKSLAIASLQILSLLLLASSGQSRALFTNLTVYVHEFRSGEGQSIFPVAGLSNVTWGFNQFGTVFVVDNTLTQSVSVKSALVGCLQGIAAVASLDNTNIELAETFLFTDGKYNGSTLEMKGILIQSMHVNEVAIVGGTKQFRHATGYITFETVRTTEDYITASPIRVRPVTTYKGEAAVIFSKEDADRLAAPFRWTLVGKFSHGRPTLEDIRKFLASLNLRDHVTVGLMDYRHVLIRCKAESDFTRLWTRGIWHLGRYPMRVFRWTRDFHVHKESPLVPVWVNLPALPIHFFDKHSLFFILSPVGQPLFLDAATSAGTRPSVARVCVELDLLKPICSRVWVAVEGESGFWQQIVIEDLPSYCTKCWRLGHAVGDCKRNDEEFAARRVRHTVASRAPQAVADAKAQVETSAMETHAAPAKGAMVVATEGEGLGQGPTRELERAVEELQQLEAAECGTQSAGVGQSAGPEVMMRGETSAADGSLTMGKDEESVEHNRQQRGMQNESFIMELDKELDQAEGQQPLLPEQLGSVDEQPFRPVDTGLDREDGYSSQLVREAGAEEGEIAEIYVELPPMAGNLSPRMTVRQEGVAEASVQALNIDTVTKGVEGFKPGRGKGNSSQHISLSIQHPLLPDPIIFSFVHAKCSLEERSDLWQNLLADKPSSLPWCIGGDFNVIMAPHEKCGGRPFGVREGVELMSFMEAAGVFDVGFSGSNFTWCNNRRGRAKISKRLDRVLINGECAEVSSSISVEHLARHPSDHAPLRISFATRLDSKPRPFRFLNVWLSRADLLEVIRGAWDRPVQGAPLRVLCQKLMASRRAIQDWNKLTFGNIFEKVRVAEAAVCRTEIEVEGNASEMAQNVLHQAQADLSLALVIEEQFWSQKARVKWLHSGDRNSKFFHAVVKQRRIQSAIHRIKDSRGAWVNRDEDIANEAIAFFSGLFSEPTVFASDMLHLIPPLITEEENKALEEVPSMAEVRRVVFAMDGESAAGPDGFTGKFFTFAWDVIAQDIYNVVLSFFCGAELPKFITSTSIVLIPKVANPQDFSMFRPISLCNFFNKVLSRLLADRLSAILPKIISPQQSGFVKGRNITENYLLAQEVLSGIGKASRGGNVALKLDISKAYDRVSWTHIVSVLRRFGFGEQFIDRLYHQSSGQLVNAQKSGYLVHPSLPPSRRRVIERITQFARNSFPIRYLGFPLYLGRCRSSYFGAVSQAIIGRVLSWKSRLLSPGGKLILIKHVLASVPVHLLSAAVVPSSVFSMIEKVCANFLWGSMAEKSKFHWIRWSQLCYPVEEGGVGFRRLRDVYRAFSCKLWWGFRTGASLWASYMQAKYCREQHPCQVPLRVSVTATWRRMWYVSQQVELSMLWHINGDACHFWYDNWVGSGALSLSSTVIPDLSFGDFITNGTWDAQLLSRALPPGIIPLILQHPIPDGGRAAEPVWMPSTSGKFTLASAFGEVRQACNTSAVLSHVWHHRIPLKIAMEIWGYFGGVCGVASTGSLLRARMAAWWNKAIFEDKPLQSADIVRAIFKEVKMLVEIQFKGNVGVNTFLQLYEWSSHPARTFGFQLIRWAVPEVGRLMLNTDGCSKGNPGLGGGGGVLRDSSGSPLFAFSAFLGVTSSLRAETMALLIGLRECGQKGFGNVGIQLDSLVLVGILRKQFQCPWHVRREVGQIWQLLGESPRIIHCYREANNVADILSNVGVAHPEHKVRVYDHIRLIP
ncbi:uncharacterized protein [Coffea arabica]|uniref:RNase H type-1 domain-containing protein n=1 Tax=Coffea arabica TaxID=13443 RepID=A0A6P6S4U7_COFAR